MFLDYFSLCHYNISINSAQFYLYVFKDHPGSKWDMPSKSEQH